MQSAPPKGLRLGAQRFSVAEPISPPLTPVIRVWPATVPAVIAQFLVYNEFEQRFSTSRTVNCLLTTQISLIDTTQPTRSIFSAGTAGTVAGQTRITGVNGGLIGSATLNLCAALDPTGGCIPSTVTPERGAAYNLNQFADRDEADFIRVP